MDNRLRNLSKNTYAGMTGVTLVIIPFILTAIFTGISVATSTPEADGQLMGMDMYLPANYSDMNMSQAQQYLHNKHGGKPDFYLKWWEFSLDPPFICEEYVKFPDGYEMTHSNYWKFIRGQADNIDEDFMTIAKNILFVDPPLLSELGKFGLIVRMILIACVGVGLTDIIWVG